MNLAVDPRYHDLREEVDKLGALSGAAVDWRRVESLGAALVRDLPPDLNVLVYTAFARFKLHGLPALPDGLQALAALLTDPPPTLTPQRPRHRGHALEWLLARLRPELDALAPAAARAPDHQALATALRALRAAGRHALGDMSPSFSAIVQRADALSAESTALAAPPPSDESPRSTAHIPAPLADGSSQSTILAAPPPSPSPAPSSPPSAHAPSLSDSPSHAPAPAPSPPSSPRPPALPAVPPVPADLAALDPFLLHCGDALESTARTIAPLDPRAIRLLRVGLWLHLHTSPPRRPDGTTTIPGLAERERARLDELAAHAQWPALLARSESLLGQHRLALDLQRHSATALAALGPDAAPALLALRAELQALLIRLPELPDLRDRDGHPLADPATRRWLADLHPSAPSASPTATDPDDPAFWTDLAARLRGPDRAAALADAHRRIAASPSEHVRSHRRLALAEACERAGDGLAAACFAALADDLRALTVERYDPGLAARCLAGLARAEPPGPARRDVLARLARLDPAAAAAVLDDARRPPT